jgi:hypothetical protein
MKHADTMRNQLAGVSADPSDPMADNLAILLVGYYEDHPDCPDDGEPGAERDDERATWKVWALDHTDAMLERLATAAEAMPSDKHAKATKRIADLTGLVGSLLATLDELQRRPGPEWFVTHEAKTAADRARGVLREMGVVATDGRAAPKARNPLTSCAAD